MLDKMKTWIKKATEIEPFDVSRFNDPLAEVVEWVPLKRGGSNFHTHKMVEVDAHRMEFRPTIGAKLFAGIFIAVGIIFPVLFLTAGSDSPDMDSAWAPLGIIVFGLVFAGAGGAMWYTMGKPRVFDKWAGMYWKGHKKPDLLYKPVDENDKAKQDAAMLRDVHAIQLIREYVRSDKSSYYSYELNLVLADGSRVNVIDHGKKSEIMDDARKLGEFLGVPVWNTFSIE